MFTEIRKCPLCRGKKFEKIQTDYLVNNFYTKEIILDLVLTNTPLG